MGAGAGGRQQVDELLEQVRQFDSELRRVCPYVARSLKALRLRTARGSVVLVEGV